MSDTTILQISDGQAINFVVTTYQAITGAGRTDVRYFIHKDLDCEQYQRLLLTISYDSEPAIISITIPKNDSNCWFQIMDANTHNQALWIINVDHVGDYAANLVARSDLSVRHLIGTPILCFDGASFTLYDPDDFLVWYLGRT